MLVKENLMPSKDMNWNMGHDSDGKKTVTKINRYTEIEIESYGSQWNYFTFGQGKLTILNEHHNKTMTISLCLKYSIDTIINSLTLCKNTTKDMIIVNSNFRGESLNANEIKTISATGQKNDLEVTSQAVYLSIKREVGLKSKFTIYSPMINLGDKAADIYIPAKADLKNSNLYPIDGNYEEIKAT